MSIDFCDTICALATAPGGALGIIRVSGPKAFDAVTAICPVRCSDAAGNTVHYTHIISPQGEMIDEVMVSIFKAPHSYTGEDSVEISCHGSPYILNKVLELLCANGCRMAKPGEYTQRAFLNGKMDLSQAEAVADLIASSSETSHRIALNQMRGSVSHRLSELRTDLLRLTSLLELELDFSEEDVEFADRSQLLSIAEATATEIARLSDSFADGNALKTGVPVAIIGAPNVGKSTLLNALLRDDKAIVSPVSGTTRDTIEDTLTLGGILFRFIDTAGLRRTDNSIEQMGIERTLRAAKQAHIIIMMTEPGVPYPDIETTPQQHVIKIVNKTEDFQALHGVGLAQLEQQLVAAVPQVADDSVLITNARHKQALDLAYADITAAIASLRSGASGDLVAEHLRLCITHLAEIAGEISSQAVLENIFKNFCVGK